MKVLYIFPHPDDESFGVAHCINKQKREGHQVYLLTLTKGEATKQRFVYGYTLEQMGEIRYREMIEVQKVLNLDGMKVLDLPDSKLQHLDPRVIEEIVLREIEEIQPEVIVTYPVYGISGFYDHLIIHGIVKRVFAESRGRLPYLRRLAFQAMTEEHAKCSPHFPLKWSAEDDIDCVVELNDEDIAAACAALDCYTTFKATIELSGIKSMLRKQLAFEFYDENFTPPVASLFDSLP